MNGSGVNVAGCASCEGNCCRSYKVPVNVADVRRLAAGMALHPREFVELREEEDGDFRLRADGPLYNVYLRRRPSGACVLLMEISATKARCGVYAHRPLVCSNFPTTLTDGMVAIRQDTVCGPNSWNLATMDLSTYRRDALRNRAAWTEHLRLADAWNMVVDADVRELPPDDLFDFFLARDRAGQPAEPAPVTS